MVARYGRILSCTPADTFGCNGESSVRSNIATAYGTVCCDVAYRTSSDCGHSIIRGKTDLVGVVSASPISGIGSDIVSGRGRKAAY